jgi:hypothetical protein
VAIRELVTSVFPAEHRPSVLAAIDRYTLPDGLFPFSTGRIQLDIIRASGGDHSKVPDLIKRAERHFLDVVVTAENPNGLARVQSWQHSRNPFKRLDPSTPELRAAQDADLRQFGMWLLEHAEREPGDMSAERSRSTS